MDVRFCWPFIEQLKSNVEKSTVKNKKGEVEEMSYSCVFVQHKSLSLFSNFFELTWAICAINNSLRSENAPAIHKYRIHGVAEHTVSSLAMDMFTIITYCVSVYPQKDGQVELAWLAG